MAIEDTYNSIIGDMRQRKEKTQKKKDKNKLISAVAGAGVFIGNAMLKQKATEFLESEDFMREEKQFKKGYNLSNSYITTEKAARDNVLGYDSYWSNVAGAATVDEAMKQKFTDKSLYSTTEWNALKQKTQASVGAEARAYHEEGLAGAQKFINSTGTQGADFYANYAKESRPTSIKDLILNKTKSMFGGKDLNPDLRAETRKKYLTSAQAIIAYDKAYDETGSSAVAEFLADKTIKLGAAPSTSVESLRDLGGTDAFGNPVGEEIVVTVTDPLGNVTIAARDGSAVLSERQIDANVQMTAFVAANSADGVGTEPVRNIGKIALSSSSYDDDREFFEDFIKAAGRKSFGTARTKALDAQTRYVHASIAGLKQIFVGQYNLSEPQSNRLAVSMFRQNLEAQEVMAENNVLDSNPFNYANPIGIAIAMARQQTTAGVPRQFSAADIQEVLVNTGGLEQMFVDYKELTPKGMQTYDTLISETGDGYLAKVHDRMKSFVKISEDNNNTLDLGKIQSIYTSQQISAPLAIKGVTNLAALNAAAVGVPTTEVDTPSLIADLPVPAQAATTRQGRRQEDKALTQQRKEYLEIIKVQKRLEFTQDLIKNPTVLANVPRYERNEKKIQTELEKVYRSYMDKYQKAGELDEQ